MKTTGSEIQSYRQMETLPSKTHKTYYDSFNPYLNHKGWDIGFKIPCKTSVVQEKSKKNHNSEVIQFVVGDKLFSVSKQLEDLIEEIKFSENLILLEEDWDCNGGLSLDKKLYFSTIDFIVLYSEHLLKSYNIVIQSPEINLCPNGSLDLSWMTDKARLLINMKINNGIISGRFYGYQKSLNENSELVKIEKEGSIDMSNFDEFLAVWMKVLV
ncbi:hypothetical protein [Pedobacter gandavensis]|uniref:Uncharacterized protein n=1 Tax=Pedobacter gandavensis TaxID=2679963 RepID=A0ABR6EU89_9SPHI|nr:hypothetical protein [Pedobacter gandavensis]MBB2148824.1 hypothetical protein [Pedobacter gandavensis]